MNDFNTQANNFQKPLNAHVDNRTGLFNSSLNVATILGNYRVGPGVELVFRYTPLDNINIGFGIGYSLGFTYYDTSTKTLYLSSGERYVITETSNQPIVNQKKINSFIFEKNYEKDEYLIIWKSGVIETLYGEGHFSKIKYLKKITSTYGDVINFRWDFIGQLGRLSEIYDDYNSLCEFSYNENISFQISLFPNRIEGQKIKFRFSNNYVTSIESVNEDLILEWFLDYTKVDTFYLLNMISHPNGLVEHADYKSGVMKFPSGANLPPLPAVSRFSVTPGFGQDKIITTYDYSTSNYLGYGTYNQWSPDKDYLFGILDEYEYWVVEQSIIDDEVDSETTYRYNNFHLLTHEEYKKGNHQRKVENHYYAKKNVTFEEQPKQYQFIREQKITYVDMNGFREESMYYEFDENGNPLLSINVDKSQVIYEYYDPEIDDGSPIDPHGFIKYIKNEHHIPTETNYNVPTNTIHYTYSSIKINVDGAEINVTFNDEKSTYSDDFMFLNEKFNYHLDGVLFGRLSSVVTKFKSSPNTEEKVNVIDYIWELNDSKITHTSKIKTFDNLTATSKSISSALDGRLIYEKDSRGNTIEWEYDYLSRVKVQSINSGTDYNQSVFFDYTFTSQGNVTETTDVFKNKSRMYFDGLGRNIITDVNSQDNSNMSFVTSTKTDYDGKGRIKLKSSLDHYLNSTEAFSKLDYKALYNPWGDNSDIVINNSYLSHGEYSPVLNLSNSFLGKFSDDKIQTDDHLGITRTIYNENHLPVQSIRLHKNGALHSEINRSFDGLGRVRQEIDELNNKVEFFYDIFGRLIEQHLPDGTKVIRDYVDFSGSALQTSITVISNDGNEYHLGTQRFDGFERLVESNVGNRKYTYIYNGTNQQPDKVILPNGNAVDYQYIPQLNDAISNIKAHDITNTFEYNNKNALLERAVNNSSSIKFDYYDSGLIKNETTSIIKSGELLDTQFSWSSFGELNSYDDAFGKQRNIFYKNNGFIDKITDSSVNALYSRDEFGRIINVSVNDGEKSCVTTLEYDDFGNEIVRSVTFSSGDSFTIATEYYLNGQVSIVRTYHSNILITTESFEYDSRNRLVNYSASGSNLPNDLFGNEINNQKIVWDALNNHVSCEYTFTIGSNLSLFKYENDHDPAQLTSIINTNLSYPPLVSLLYDAEGRLINDGYGNSMNYNDLGQLINFNNIVEYGYDAFGRLLEQNHPNDEYVNLYYISNELCGELGSNEKSVRYISSEFGNIGVEEVNR